MSISRRQFLQYGLAASAGLALPRFALAQSEDDELTGNIRPVHDPCIIKAKDTYYLYCTGPYCTFRTSTDLKQWDRAGNVFEKGVPDWAVQILPKNEGIWAPDISYFNDRFHLYYAVSSFGKNHSVIGLLTNTTLDPNNEHYQWVDEGLVLESTAADNFNAIDPNLIIDADGAAWLAFGSFWSGIKMRRLDATTGKLSADDDKLYSLASRKVNQGAVEAPFIIRKGDFYYLFTSFDFCCRGVDSTYHVVVGRSESITGPYFDRDGTPMLEGGGTQVTFPSKRWRGPGHNAILQEDGEEKIVYHAYDAERGGAPTLRINPLAWDQDGWPSIG
jgi:arabinan endo-1,5-alpha-L-arabinosidase